MLFLQDQALFFGTAVPCPSPTGAMRCKRSKTYNSGYSLVVTHLTTNPPVRCLNRAERTGSLVFNVLWSYVEVILIKIIYKVVQIRVEARGRRSFTKRGHIDIDIDTSFRAYVCVFVYMYVEGLFLFLYEHFSVKRDYRCRLGRVHSLQ